MKKQMQSTASQRLRALLIPRGITLDDLAERIGILPRTMFNRLRKEDWSLQDYMRIRKEIPDVPADDLLAAMVTGYRRERNLDLMDMTRPENEELAKGSIRKAEEVAPPVYQELTEEERAAVQEDFEASNLSGKI